jgi:hypothetical protein
MIRLDRRRFKLDLPTVHELRDTYENPLAVLSRAATACDAH